MAVDMKKLIQGYINMTKTIMAKSFTILKDTAVLSVETFMNASKILDEVNKKIISPKDVAKRLPCGDLIGEILSL